MRHLLTILACGLGFLLAPSLARAALIEVDLSSQTMHVSSGSGDYVWPISSARTGFVTPRGTYGVQRLEAMHRSHKYHNSPMPHSIFFHGGYAIHGTYSTASLGIPASHGCIRISPDHAATLYAIVRAEGARISITGSAPSSTRYARAERGSRAEQAMARQMMVPELDDELPRYAPSFDDWSGSPTAYSEPGAMDYEPSDD